MTARQPTRRSFLKAAAAASTVPYVWTSSQARALAANDGFGVLAVGVRGRGGGAGRDAGKFGRVVAACDVDTASIDGFVQSLAKQQDLKPTAYKDYRQALQQPDVDVVTIGTPDHWHTAILIAAVRAGKDVYCEKPMTLTIDEGKKICQAVKETGRVVQVGTQQRSSYNRMFLKAVAIARSGRLGQKLTAHCYIGRSPSGGPFATGDPPPTLDWDFWLGQTPYVPYTAERCHGSFRWWLEYSGGKMTDWGAHHVDIAQWALGAEHTGPVQIEGRGDFPQGRQPTLDMISGKTQPTDIPNGYNTATEFEVRLDFANGNTIIVRHSPPDRKENGILIEGEQGRIFVNRGKLTGAPVEQIAQSPSESQQLDQQVVQLYHGKEPASHMANFIDAVRGQAQVVSDVFTHHRSVSSCHLCNIAMLLGRKLTWDPDAEDFPGDPQAASLLSRKQRPPYAIEA